MNDKSIYCKANIHQESTMFSVKSFVRRQGRITKRQRYALDNYWPLMGIEYQCTTINISAFFKSQAPVILEIGFGMGDSLVIMAAKYPQYNFLGIEVYLPGVGACLYSAQKSNISNLRIICHDALEVLENMIPNCSLLQVQLFFPDIWHKRRHQKRRIVQSKFVELVYNKLDTNGILHMATDWEPYAIHMLKIMTTAAAHYRNLSDDDNFVPRPETRSLTKFEKRGYILGHHIWDLMFKKIL